MKVGLDGGIKLEFHGAKVTSNGGLLAGYEDVNDAEILAWIERLRCYSV